MPALSILLLGDADRTEFRDARTCMHRWGTVCEVAEMEAAAAALTGGHVVPDVIVVAQAFPGQFSHGAIDRLRRLAPLAKVLGLMGSWCEGEMRSGSPWPATVRTYWHRWPARCNREFHRLTRGQACSWALPVTATEEERLLMDANCRGHRPHPNPLPKGDGTKECNLLLKGEATKECRGTVVIRSPSLEMADWLSAACRRRGFATLWQRGADGVRGCEKMGTGSEPARANLGKSASREAPVPMFSQPLRVEGATAAIFDGSDLNEDELAELQRLVATLHPAPVVVLLTFPRVEHHRRAVSAGAAAVLSKPVAVEDLFWQIDAVRPPP